MSWAQLKEIAGAKVKDRDQFEYERPVERAVLVDKNGSERRDGSDPPFVPIVVNG
jgi:hypothetical protein